MAELLNLSQYPEFNVSGDNTHDRCPRRWYLTDRHWGLGAGSFITGMPQYNGILFHDVISAWYGAEKQVPILSLVQPAIEAVYAKLEERSEHLTPEKVAMMLEAEDLVRYMAQGYETWANSYEGPMSDKVLQYQAVEHEATAVIEPYMFRMRMDGAAYEPEYGEWWVVEHKTSSRPDDLANALRWDLQPRAYVWALSEILGKPVSGIIYNLVKRTNPYNIKLLTAKRSEGLPSKSREVLDGTSYAIYRDTLVSCAIRVGRDALSILEEYEEQLKYLEEREAQGKGLFRRVVLRFPPEMIAKVPDMLRQKAARLVEDRGPHAPTCLNRHECYPYCPVREVCWAMDAGLDWKSVLWSTFHPSGSEPEVVGELETLY